MSADDKPTEAVNGLPKPLVVPFVAGLTATIFLCGLMIYSQRDRFDATVYLWCGTLIAVMFPVCIVLAIWQQKQKERARRKPFRPPWPESANNPKFGGTLNIPKVSLAGRFQWTPDTFARLAKDWCRHTPAGRSHRRDILGLTSIGLAGIVLATVFLWQRQWSAIALVVASGLLLLFAYSCRIRPPRAIRSRTEIYWKLTREQLTVSSEEDQRIVEWGSVYAVLQTRAGFLLWPHDFIEMLLPTSAFANQNELTLFAELAQSRVQNFVRVD